MRPLFSRRAVFGALLFASAACGEKTPSGRSAPIAPVSPGASNAGAGAALPCDVVKVVADRCQLCHAATLSGRNGLSNTGNICMDDPDFASIPLP